MVGVTGYAPLDAFFTPYAVQSQHQLDLIIQQNLLKKYIDKFEKDQNAHLLGALTVSPREIQISLSTLFRTFRGSNCAFPRSRPRSRFSRQWG